MRPVFSTTDWTAPPLPPPPPKPSTTDRPCGSSGQSADSGCSSGKRRSERGPGHTKGRGLLFGERAMTIAKAMQSDKAFCRRVNTVRVARWRGKHRQRFNAYMREYQRRYRQRKREA